MVASDSSYDVLYQGHITFLRRAKELGDYLIVDVTSDRVNRNSGKLNVWNSVMERGGGGEGDGYVDKVGCDNRRKRRMNQIQLIIDISNRLSSEAYQQTHAQFLNVNYETI